jgi:prepilin-type N-terminal cleavage/methylation domain-containing protein
MVYFRFNQRGLSFVEMMVVLSLFTVLSLVITNAIASFYRYNAYTIAQSYQVEHARRGVDLLVRDMREMTYADNGAFPLVAMGTSSITFYSDIDRDESVELVTYELASSTLYKYVYNATGSPPSYDTDVPDETYTISEYVQNGVQGTDIFTFSDATGTALALPAPAAYVRYVDVTLIVNIDPIRDPGQFMLRSSAALRNLIETL